MDLTYPRGSWYEERVIVTLVSLYDHKIGWEYRG